MNPARKRAYTQLLIVAVIWGVGTPVIKYTLGGFSPALFLTYRFFISTLIAAGIFIFTKVRIPKNPRVLAVTLLNAFLLSTVSLGLLFLGTDKTTSIDSNLISAMAPIVIAISGVFFLKERVTKRESIGMLIALTGTVITVIGPVLKVNSSFGGLEGNLLVLASVIVSAATAIIAKIVLRDDVDAGFASNSAFIVGLITMLPIVLLMNPGKNIVTEIIQTPLKFHLGVLYMAILSGSLAYFLWHKAEKTIEVGEVNLVAYLYPIFGAPLSIIWLNERITLPVIIGSIIIAIGVLLAEWKKRK